MRWPKLFALLCVSWLLYGSIGMVQSQSSFIRQLSGTEPLDQEWSWVVLEIPEGYILAGSEDDHSFLRAYSHDDELLWTRRFDFSEKTDFIRDLILDSEGHLVGIGRDDRFGGTLNFMFRYDYVSNELLWLHRRSEEDGAWFESVVESTPGGDFWVFGLSAFDQGPGFGTDYLMLELDRNTGVVTDQNHSHIGNTDVFYDALSIDNAVYGVGVERYSGSLNSLRPSIGRFDAAGDLEWNRSYLRSPGASARLYNTSVIAHDNHLVLTTRGSLISDDLDDGIGILYQVDLNGEYVNGWTYDILLGQREQPFQLVAVPDGYIMAGDFLPFGSNNRDIFVFRLNDDFEIQWSIAIGGEDDELLRGPIWKSSSFYFGGWTENDLNKDALLGKIAEADLEDFILECDWVREIDVARNELGNPYQGDSSPDPYLKTLSFYSGVLLGVPIELEADTICSLACEAPVFSVELQPDCLTGNTDLVLSDVSGNGPFLYSLDGGLTYSSETAALEGLQPGTYEVVVQDAEGCFSNTVPITVDPIDPLVLSGDTLVQVNPGESAQLIVQVNQAVTNLDTLFWTPSLFLSCTDCLTPEVTPEQDTTYLVVAEDDRGCLDSLAIQVEIVEPCSIDDLAVPNIFTPDGDGVNDLFRPLTGNEQLEVRLFQVYNRWGESVFSSENPDVAWDGRQGEEPCPQDTYVYYLELACPEENFVRYGEITLIR